MMSGISPHRTWIEIDSKALEHNARALRNFIEPETALLAVVKANAYGHGIEQVLPSFEPHVDWYGVDSLEEADRVRALSQKPVLILNPMHPQNAPMIVQRGFHQMVSTAQDLIALEKAAAAQHGSAPVHLKFDTGMSRQGATNEERSALLITAQESPHVHITGLATHFATADEPGSSALDAQQQMFRTLLDELAQRNIGTEALAHAANSAATLLRPDTHYQMVRVGIALYGAWPSPAVANKTEREIHPALSLRSRIAQVKTLEPGSRVGYGHTKHVSRETRAALLPLGYADGYHRAYGERAHALVHGQEAPVLGRVSMDLMSIDVTDIPGVRAGDTRLAAARSTRPSG